MEVRVASQPGRNYFVVNNGESIRANRSDFYDTRNYAATRVGRYDAIEIKMTWPIDATLWNRHKLRIMLTHGNTNAVATDIRATTGDDSRNN